MPSYPGATKYEIIKALGTRAEQIRRGAPPAVDVDARAPWDPRRIAMEELRKGVCPLKVRRTNGAIVHFTSETMSTAESVLDFFVANNGSHIIRP
jgi:DNA-directed RNA polymerase subunit K/omega